MSRYAIKLSEPRRVVFIVAHDAYLKGARNICTLLEKQNKIQVSWFTTSKRLEGLGLSWLDIARLNMEQSWKNKALQQADLIFAGLGGRALNQLIHHLKRSDAAVSEGQAQPRIIGYFPGVLHLRIFESLATRLRCDQVLLNCERDYRLYQQLALSTTGEDNGLLFGSPWIGSPPESDKPCDIDLLFVEQSIVPETQNDRIRLVKCLIALSRQYPKWRIVVALRARKGQASSHQLKYCLEEISQQLLADHTPLEFVLDDIDQLLARARRVATISSSAAYTSLAWGKPTLFIRDLGIKQSWGNDLFKKSGYLGLTQRVGELTFSANGWFKQFIQSPRLAVISSLINPPAPICSTAIPRFNIKNIRLLWLVLKFCLKSRKSPLSELRILLRTIDNINVRIYNIK